MFINNFELICEKKVSNLVILLLRLRGLSGLTPIGIGCEIILKDLTNYDGSSKRSCVTVSWAIFLS